MSGALARSVADVPGALVATVAATVGMYGTNSLHPPAYATVLIVSLEEYGPWRPPYSL